MVVEVREFWRRSDGFVVLSCQELFCEMVVLIPGGTFKESNQDMEEKGMRGTTKDTRQTGK